MKRQFWLIGIVLLLALSACRSKSKEGQTDTYSSGVIAIAADASLMYSRACILWPGLSLATRRKWKRLIYF